MLETLHQIYQIKTTSAINGFLYFLKKIPFIGGLFRDTSYTFPRLKNALGIVSIIYRILSTLIGSLLIFLFLYLPGIFISRENVALSLATLMFFIYYVMRILTSEILQYEMNKFIMIRQMRMDARNYALASTIPKEILKFLTKALIFSFFLPFGTWPWIPILLALSISSFAVFSEALHLFLYRRFGFNFSRRTTLSLVLIIVIMFAAYALAFISPFAVFRDLLTSPWFLAVTIFSGIPSAFYLFSFDRYGEAMAETNNLENLVSMQKAVTNARVKDIQVREKDYRDMDLSDSGKRTKEGYSYLNDIFFKRHRRMVYRPMLIKSAVITFVFLALNITVIWFIPETAAELGQVIYDQYTLFIFAMYILCNSEKITRSMFYNCDLSLLRYGFYKKGDALLRMFTLRLLTITGYNLVPTTLLAGGVTFTVLRHTTISLLEILPVLLLLYALALFFSVHYLFMYYIFQPFTSSMQMKNPFYALINFAVYFFSWILLQVPAPPDLFLPIMTLLLIIYTAGALFLVYRKAPQTFRIK